MQIYSLADVTLGAAATPLTATSQLCKWFQVVGITVATTARIGDASVTATRGAPLYSGGSQFSPPVADANNPYDLATVNIIGTAGDTVSVIYAV